MIRQIFITTAGDKPRDTCTIQGRDFDGNPISETVDLTPWLPPARKLTRALRLGRGRAARRERAADGLYGRARTAGQRLVVILKTLRVCR